MIFVLKNPYDVPRYKDYVNKLYKEEATVEVIKKSVKRSLSQNSYLHVILGFFGAEYGCSIDEAKVDFYKRECNRELFERTRINKRGKEVKYLRSSSDLSVSEMKLSIDRFRNYSASVAGIYLPSSDEHHLLLYAQQVIERNQEFL